MSAHVSSYDVSVTSFLVLTDASSIEVRQRKRERLQLQQERIFITSIKYKMFANRVSVVLKDAETDRVYPVLVTADEAKRLETGKFCTIVLSIF